MDERCAGEAGQIGRVAAKNRIEGVGADRTVALDAAGELADRRGAGYVDVIGRRIEINPGADGAE